MVAVESRDLDLKRAKLSLTLMQIKGKLRDRFSLFAATSLLAAPVCNLPLPIIGPGIPCAKIPYRGLGSSMKRQGKREENGSLYTAGCVSQSSVMPLQNGALTSCF